jgi:hypothetical protein
VLALAGRLGAAGGVGISAAAELEVAAAGQGEGENAEQQFHSAHGSPHGRNARAGIMGGG